MIDDYLPDDFYQALRETFPDESTYESDDSGRRRASGRQSSPIRSIPFATRHPAWRQLIDFFSSADFTADARKALSPALLDARGIMERRPWLDCTKRAVPNNPLRYVFQEPIRTTFQISLAPSRRGRRPPHGRAAQVDQPAALLPRSRLGGFLRRGDRVLCTLGSRPRPHLGSDRPNPLRIFQGDWRSAIRTQPLVGFRALGCILPWSTTDHVPSRKCRAACS